LTHYLHEVEVQATIPHVQPTAVELEEMNSRAVAVVRLLEEFRRMSIPEDERDKAEVSPSMEDSRPPKRPWEDISQDAGGSGRTEGASGQTESPDKSQSTAEQDMELIRNKRATSAAGGTTTIGQPKSKYRKRSVSIDFTYIFL
jgi:hypothetical protein